MKTSTREGKGARKRERARKTERVVRTICQPQLQKPPQKQQIHLLGWFLCYEKESDESAEIWTGFPCKTCQKDSIWNRTHSNVLKRNDLDFHAVAIFSVGEYYLHWNWKCFGNDRTNERIFAHSRWISLSHTHTHPLSLSLAPKIKFMVFRWKE